MQNRNSEELYALIKGMSKCEKKSFHLYARRNINSQNLKVLAVYHAINTMDEYDEKKLMNRLKGVQPKQIPGLKGSLYNLLLDSLRLIKKGESIDLQLHQLMDHAKILYDKGFPVPSLKALKKVKALALNYHQVSFAFQAVVMEKKIELVHGTCEASKIKALNKEMNDYSHELQLIGQFSNTSMLLYGWYKRHGRVRNEEDKKAIEELYDNGLQQNESLSFYPKLYLLQAKTYYYLIRKKDDEFNKWSREWVYLFHLHPEMKEIEATQYARGLTYLSESALLLNDLKTIHFCRRQLKTNRDAFYHLIAQLNCAIAENNYDKELLIEIGSLIQSINNSERIILLCYKAASICAMHKQWERSIDFTHKAINTHSSSRLDLQYQIRLLHIQAHKEIGNDELVQYLGQSAKRFAKSFTT